jgi:hypothetical protein
MKDIFLLWSTPYRYEGGECNHLVHARIAPPISSSIENLIALSVREAHNEAVRAPN